MRKIFNYTWKIFIRAVSPVGSSVADNVLRRTCSPKQFGSSTSSSWSSKTPQTSPSIKLSCCGCSTKRAGSSFMGSSSQPHFGPPIPHSHHASQLTLNRIFLFINMKNLKMQVSLGGIIKFAIAPILLVLSIGVATTVIAGLHPANFVRRSSPHPDKMEHLIFILRKCTIRC